MARVLKTNKPFYITTNSKHFRFNNFRDILSVGPWLPANGHAH